jgi:hypothetical protein
LTLRPPGPVFILDWEIVSRENPCGTTTAHADPAADFLVFHTSQLDFGVIPRYHLRLKEDK